MRQYILIAYDAKDEGAPGRRMAVREEHLDLIAQLRARGNALIGVAITDPNEKMIGSLIVVNFPSRVELDAWLKIEPYVTHHVWEDITILNGKLAPAFEDLIRKVS
jgi:uncharacterized protein YciI